ncbi:MAG: guanylate kinase [Pyrinomonadaceae bacterium]|nr:guanylate kinase [Phycisphaerales bacterium]
MSGPPSNSVDRHRLSTDTDDGMLLIMSGPSGVGKTTITRAIERNIPGAVFSVSATTRPKTAADAEGIDYHFVSDAEFDRLIAENAFLEWANVFGRRYGTLRAWVEEQLARGRLVILEIDVEGAENVKRQIPDSYGIFIEPPSEDVLLERLRARRREDEQVIQRRFAEARREIAQARAGKVYDAFIVNHVLEEAIELALVKVRGELRRRVGH